MRKYLLFSRLFDLYVTDTAFIDWYPFRLGIESVFACATYLVGPGRAPGEGPGQAIKEVFNLRLNFLLCIVFLQVIFIPKLQKSPRLP